MDRDETIVDIVNRLERAVSRLERVLDGDAQLAAPGLLAEHRQMQADIAEIKRDNCRRQTNAAQWFAGYVIFIAAFAAANDHLQTMFALPPLAGMMISITLAGVAFIFFANGLGFIQWKQ